MKNASMLFLLVAAAASVAAGSAAAQAPDKAPPEKRTKEEEGKKNDAKPGRGDRDKESAEDPIQDDDPELPIQDLRAGKDDRKRYVVIGPKKGAKEPKDGWRTLFVLPGGDGGPAFHGFVKNIARNVYSDDYLVVQLVSVKWKEGQEIVWPSEAVKLKEAEFTTEAFFDAVHKDLKKARKLDPKFCFTLSWSSGGPVAYRLSLRENSPIVGSHVAMSVFHPKSLPPLSRAKGRAYFIDHSPDDATCPFKQAEEARDALKEAGAKVEFRTYEGGHGWRDDPMKRLREGKAFLEKNAKAPPAR
jgi:predicted esterase